MNPQPSEYADDLEFDKIVRYLWRKYRLTVFAGNHTNIGLAGEVAALRSGVLTVNTNVRGNNCRVFVVSHVFGHIVQYCSGDKYDSLVARISASPPPIRLSAALRALHNEYEAEAFSIGLGLLKSVYKLTEDEDIQFQAFMKTDISHYLKYLTSGSAPTDGDFQKLYSINVEALRSQVFRPATFTPPPASIDPRMAKEIHVF